MKVLIFLSICAVGCLSCLRDSGCFQCTMNTLCTFIEQEDGKTYCVHARKIPEIQIPIVRQAVTIKQCRSFLRRINDPILKTTTEEIYPSSPPTTVPSSQFTNVTTTATPDYSFPIHTTTTILPVTSQATDIPFRPFERSTKLNTTQATTQVPILFASTPVSISPTDSEELASAVDGDLFYNIPIVTRCESYSESSEFRLIRSMCNMGRIFDSYGKWEGRESFFYLLNPARSYQALCSHILQTSKKCFPKKRNNSLSVNWKKRNGMGSAIFNQIPLSLKCQKNVTRESKLERLLRTTCIVAKRSLEVKQSSLSIYQKSYLNLNMAYEFPATCAILFDKRQRCFQ